MLSVSRVRELLGSSASELEDRELENLRDQLYRLARHIVSLARSGLAVDRDARPRSLGIPPALFDEFHERAAIMQYDGGLPRVTAEMRAIEIVGGSSKEDAPCGP